MIINSYIVTIEDRSFSDSFEIFTSNDLVTFDQDEALERFDKLKKEYADKDTEWYGDDVCISNINHDTGDGTILTVETHEVKITESFLTKIGL